MPASLANRTRSVLQLRRDRVTLPIDAIDGAWSNRRSRSFERGRRVMLKFIRWCSIVCALLAMPAMAQAQSTYPDRPIRFVVAFPPGGATDTFFR